MPMYFSDLHVGVKVQILADLPTIGSCLNRVKKFIVSHHHTSKCHYFTKNIFHHTELLI